jgi:hypothetical protein
VNHDLLNLDLLNCGVVNRDPVNRARSPPEMRLRAAFGFLHGQLRALESDAAVGSIAERFVD